MENSEIRSHKIHQGDNDSFHSFIQPSTRMHFAPDGNTLRVNKNGRFFRLLFAMISISSCFTVLLVYVCMTAKCGQVLLIIRSFCSVDAVLTRKLANSILSDSNQKRKFSLQKKRTEFFRAVLKTIDGTFMYCKKWLYFSNVCVSSVGPAGPSFLKSFLFANLEALWAIFAMLFKQKPLKLKTNVKI